MGEANSERSGEAPSAPAAGRQLGDYRLLRRLGEGAMAEVYLAEQRSLRRPVAVKILRRALAKDATYVKRLHREAMAAAALIHANIVQIYQIGRVGDLYFIAQEYVAGENLGQWIDGHGRASATMAIGVMRQVAAALAKAAERQIVHRDIKPENIMLARSGEVKVADFGLARKGGPETGLTQAGVTMGTPLYMSPEQIEGRPLDTRSDIYSLGVTCYHMLSGKPPFEADTALAVAVHHLNTPPPDLRQLRGDVPTDLCRIVHKMLCKKPEDRYQTPGQLLDDLRALVRAGRGEAWAEGLGPWDTGAQPTPVGGSISPTVQLDQLMKTGTLATRQRRVSRRWLMATVAAGGLLGLLTAAGVRGLSRRPTDVRAGPIPRRENAWGQLYYAKTHDSPPAWQAVWQYFPGNPLAGNLARQGLVQHFVRVGQLTQALPLLDQLVSLGPEQPAFRGFGLAGKSLVLMLLERQEEAADVLEQLTPEMVARLPRYARRALRDVLSRQPTKLRGKARSVFEQLKRAPLDATPFK